MSIDIESIEYYNLNKYAVLSTFGITSANKTIIMNEYSYGSFNDSYTGIIIGNKDTHKVSKALFELNNLTDAIEIYVTNSGIPQYTLNNKNYSPVKLKPGSYVLSTPSSKLLFNGSTITFDAENNPNAYFIITCDSDIKFTNVQYIKLINGASNCNIFWITKTKGITFTGTNPPSIPGIFIAESSITLHNKANVNGCLFTNNGTVNFNGNSYVNATRQNDVVCYAKGSLILTDKGFIPIEHITHKNNIITKGNIINNDFVNETEFKVKKIRWINKFKVHSLNEKSRPICIKTNALGPNVPFKDLYVSPQHGIFINGKLVRAKKLINNDTIFQDNECTEVEYYHVECNYHSAILANGILSESYLEIGNNRKLFENTKNK